MMGGWMSALGSMGGTSALGGAAGGAAGGGFMSTLGKIGKGLGSAANYYNGQNGNQAARPVSGWSDASQPQNALQDEVKRQLEAMKQERILKDLMRYQPLEGQGGISGMTINPYR